MVISILLIVSAAHCKRPCVNGHLNPVFIGFSAADINTFVLRAYKPNDNYLHLVDTILVANYGATIYTTTNDTTIVYVNDSNPNHWICPGFDWQIYIPAKNRIVSISNIITTQTENVGRVCWNPINSLTQDGQSIVPKLVETGEFFTSGYMAYIHN